MGSPKSNANRILVIAPEPFYADRGTPIAVKHVIKAFSEYGSKVDLLTYPIGKDIEQPGLRIFRIPNLFNFKKVPIGFSARKLFLNLILIPAIWNRLSRESYSFIHAVEEAAFPAVMAGRRRKVPVVYDMQSCLSEQLKDYPIFRSSAVQKGLHLCERWLIRNADLVVCSVGLERYVQKVNPATPVMEWYFPGELVETGAEEVKRLREDLMIDHHAQVVLYAGNFQPYQELDRLIGASRKILSCLPKTVFVLVGGNDSERVAFSAETQDLVQTGSFRLLPPIPRSEISKYLAMADIVVSPRAKVGNLPLKIFDYLAAGKPIVAIDSPTIRKVLDDDRALVVNPLENDLGEAIARLLQNPERMKQLGAAARAYAEQHLGWQAFELLVSELQARVRPNGREAQDLPMDSNSA
jgi:glycosyltransferase involved in cell wall biosynthesis